MARAPSGPAKPPANSTDAILQRLTALHPKVIDLSLDRVAALMARLGNPQLKLPPVVHVAGTNGKGSLVAYLRAIAEAAGYRVHSYTSPHLVRFNERIRLAGKLIDEKRLNVLLTDIERINGAEPITFFEITTAAAFRAFMETPADLVLLETGLGGRLDATNLVPEPLLTAITPIGLDHLAFLGDTVEKIAAEKAGIMKRDVPCVIGPQQPKVAAVLAAKAKAMNAALFRHGEDWKVWAEGGTLVWEGDGRQLRLPRPGLIGPHQIENAGNAIACSQRLGALSIPDTAVAEGLYRVEWPARLQRLIEGPLVKLLPANAELWLDGGHNAMAGEALAATLAAWSSNPATKRPTYLIAGMLNTKDPGGFLAPLKPHLTGAFAVAIPGEPNSLSAEELTRAAGRHNVAAWPMPDVEQALRQLTKLLNKNEPARILIAGSLYLAGQVLARNG
jgi:dihydrofolate synthase/folylpolyglutamate synthase